MSGVDIAALLTGVAGLIAALITAFTSARKSAVGDLATALEALQAENERLRVENERLRSRIRHLEDLLKVRRHGLA